MQFQAEAVFGRSRSTNYRAAVNHAEAFDDYSISEDGRTTEHRVEIDVPITDITAIRAFMDLVQIISGWKSTRINIKTEGLPHYRDILNSIQVIDRCYRERERTGLGDIFCQTADSSGDIATFGCRKLEGVGYPGAANRVRPWTDFGELSVEGRVFTPNKHEILQILNKSSLAAGCRFCPAFSWHRVSESVEQLPSSIDIDADDRFDIENGDAATGRKPRVIFRAKGQSLVDARLLARSVVDSNGDEIVSQSRSVPRSNFSDIIGQDYAIEQIRSLVQIPLSHPDHLRALALQPPKGVLLYGPPGNGKTMLARAAASESDAHLEIVSGPELRSKYVGESERQIRDVFDRARQFAPSIILFDEIDSVAGKRDEVHSSALGEVTQLLVLLDGLEPLERVILIGTTNRPESVDPAMRRPGRLDYMIKIEPPNAQAREALIRLNLPASITSASPDLLWTLASRTDGWSAAEVASLVREAKMLAVKRAVQAGTSVSELEVSPTDLSQGFDELQRKRRIS